MNAWPNNLVWAFEWLRIQQSVFNGTYSNDYFFVRACKVCVWSCAWIPFNTLQNAYELHKVKQLHTYIPEEISTNLKSAAAIVLFPAPVRPTTPNLRPPQSMKDTPLKTVTSPSPYRRYTLSNSTSPLPGQLDGKPCICSYVCVHTCHTRVCAYMYVYICIYIYIYICTHK